VALSCCASADACSRCGNFKNCRFAVKQVVAVEHVVQPQIIKQNIFYGVGYDARASVLAYQGVQVAAEGQLAREMQRLQDRFAELQQYQQQALAYRQPVYMVAPQQAYVQPQTQCVTCQGQQPMQPPADPQPPQFSLQEGGVVQSACIKCHSGATPKAGMDLTQPNNLTLAQRLKAVSMAGSGKMPPKSAPLNDAQLAGLARELATPEELERLCAALAEQPTQ
jgi:hypothetical protein